MDHAVDLARKAPHEIDSLRVKTEEDKKKMEEQYKRADLEAMQLQEAVHTERVIYHAVDLARNALHEVDSLLRVKTEEDKKKMEEQYKRADLEAMQLQEAVPAHQMELTNKLRELQTMKQSISEAQRQLEEFSREAELLAVSTQCNHHDEQKMGENKALKMAPQDQMNKFELQKQHVMLGIVEANETYKGRIAELEEEQEMLQDTVNALFQIERTENDHLEDARKVAVQLLGTYGSNKIGNKMMGKIDTGPWGAVCKEKFKHHPDGWEVMMNTMISEWETRIGDQEYHPYKMLKLDDQGDKMKRIINEDDEFIKKLKEDLGAEVLQTIATALFEIEEYNASGRHPMNVPWNFQKKERVQLKDLLLFLKGLLDAAGEHGRAEKKRLRAC